MTPSWYCCSTSLTSSRALARSWSFEVGEEPAFTSDGMLERADLLLGEVVDAENHILGRDGQRCAVRRRQDVVRGEHQHLGLELSLHREGHVYRHLVAVEVRIEGRA